MTGIGVFRPLALIRELTQMGNATYCVDLI